MLVGGKNRRIIALNALHAEALAVKEAINLAIERKFQKVCLEMDFRELYFILSNKCKMIDWRVRPLVLDIQKKLQVVLESKVMLVRKEANAVEC